MSEININSLEKINKNLEILIYLTLRRDKISEMTSGEQFFLLKRFGFSDGTIADLFGKSKSYVSSEIAQQKKRSNKWMKIKISLRN